MQIEQRSRLPIHIYVEFHRALTLNIKKIVEYEMNQSNLHEQKTSMITLVDPVKECCCSHLNSVQTQSQLRSKKPD